MLRRLLDGAVLTILVWILILRLDAGQLVLGLAIAAVIVFTGWRIYRLWRKYQRLLHELAAAEAAKLSDDPKEVERAEGILRQRRMMARRRHDPDERLCPRGRSERLRADGAWRGRGWQLRRDRQRRGWRLRRRWLWRRRGLNRNTHCAVGLCVAVGTLVSQRPPHGSGRAR